MGTKQSTKSVLAGAAYDFLLHLMARPQPLVIGGNYPRDKATEELEKWMKDRNLGDTIDREGFLDG